MAEVLTHWLAGDDYSHDGGGFMGKSWDSFVPGPATWREVIRVLKPGGYALVFAGSRTVDLMAVALRLAGFEIRDQIQWIYGSGFPKSLDISKALDKAVGAEREVIGQQDVGPDMTGDNYGRNKGARRIADITGAAVTDAARQWQGWGTALKPAHEPIIVARKPLVGTVAANVLAWGVGGINIDGCRVEYEADANPATNPLYRLNGGYRPAGNDDSGSTNYSLKNGGDPSIANPLGRFPANIIHDGSDEVLACFPNAPGQQGVVTGDESSAATADVYGEYGRVASAPPRIESDTSAARFFYCAKASKSDRGEHNGHPTVKPQALMRYLCRLVTPPGGTVLDSFAGSGSTGKAALSEGFKPVLIEQCSDNFNTCCARIAEAVMSC
jgi:site-specific DNA-methyltransferase (adenine-specific)